MCKFADQDTQGYQSVLAAIKKVSVIGAKGNKDTVSNLVS